MYLGCAIRPIDGGDGTPSVYTMMSVIARQRRGLHMVDVVGEEGSGVSECPIQSAR